MIVNGYRVSFWRDENVLELGDSCSITTELFTLKGEFNAYALYLNFKNPRVKKNSA